MEMFIMFNCKFYSLSNSERIFKTRLTVSKDIAKKQSVTCFCGTQCRASERASGVRMVLKFISFKFIPTFRGIGGGAILITC